MYPTVNSLLGLWSFVTAREVKIVEHCTPEIVQFLGELQPEELFKPAVWKKLRGFVKIIPDGDILPCRENTPWRTIGRWA
jgi:hypothetical protein